MRFANLVVLIISKKGVMEEGVVGGECMVTIANGPKTDELRFSFPFEC